MRLPLIAVFIATMASSPFAHATVYKCVSDIGSVTYTNDPSSVSNCKRLRSDLPVSTVPAPPQRSTATQPANAGSFPRISPEVQRARDNTRQQLLRQEMDSEQKALEQARQTLVEEESRVAPEDRVIRNMADGSSRAIINQGRKDQRLQVYRDQIELHERNLRALEQELQRLR